MSADSLFSIVVPAPVPVAAAKAVDARGDSGFERMVGEAMDGDTEQARSAGKSDTSLTRSGANPSRPVPSPKVAADTADAGTDAVETVSEEVPPPTVPVSEAELTPVAVDGKAVDGPQILPAVAADKGIDVPQVLPGTPPVTLAPPVETPPERPLPNGKGATSPQVLPDQIEAGPAPEPVATVKGADVAQVLPGTSGKTEGPRILPDVPQTPASGKSGDRQILPGTETPAQTGAATEPAATAATAKAAAAAMAALAPAVTPPPARPLTDRNEPVSNSVRATGERGTGSTTGSTPATAPAAAVPSMSGTSTTPEIAALSDRPLTAAPGAPAAPVADAPGAAVRSPVDQPPVEAPPAAASQTPTASQTYSLSNLSNAAVEATAQMAAQIIRRMDARSTRFEMALTPDELGRVDVSLDIDEHGRLAARLAFDNPAAALDMKGRVDDLRRQLEAAGFHLADDAFQFAERDRSSGEAFDRRQGRAFAAAARLSDETDAAAPVTAPRWMSLSLTPDRVDMKV